MIHRVSGNTWLNSPVQGQHLTVSEESGQTKSKLTTSCSCCKSLLVKSRSMSTHMQFFSSVLGRVLPTSTHVDRTRKVVLFIGNRSYFVGSRRPLSLLFDFYQRLCLQRQRRFWLFLQRLSLIKPRHNILRTNFRNLGISGTYFGLCGNLDAR